MRTIVKILEDIWYRLEYFVRHDFIRILMWTGKFVVGGLIMGYCDLKKFLETRKRKGGEI